MFLSFLVFDNIFLNILVLVVGMVFLIKGADFFVEGASNVAKALKIPSLIIGLTLVSIGTSLPELSVSVNSALQNAASIAGVFLTTEAAVADLPESEPAMPGMGGAMPGMM